MWSVEQGVHFQGVSVAFLLLCLKCATVFQNGPDEAGPKIGEFVSTICLFVNFSRFGGGGGCKRFCHAGLPYCVKCDTKAMQRFS